MDRRSYPLLCVFLTLTLWLTLDCQSEATPTDLPAALVPAAPAQEELSLPEDLTEEQKALLELLQTDGMAALVCLSGYIIVPPTTGVNDLPKDNTGNPGGGDPGGGGDPPGPTDETPDPPDEPPPAETPEPGSIILGLIGLGSTMAYTRRRRKNDAA